jgi:hypothetical protein
MPTPHPRIRLGLGIIVVTALTTLAAEVLGLLFNGATTETTTALRPIAVLAMLAVTAGFWLFASRDPQAPDAPAVRLWLRIAACSLLVIETAVILNPKLLALGALAWLGSAAVFYLSLALLRHIARNTGDAPIASHSLWCMIFAPVLLLIGTASMMFIMMSIMLEANRDLAAIAGGQDAQPPAPQTPWPHIPSWAIFLPLIPMTAGGLWYLAVLAAAWLRMARPRASFPQYATA